MIDVTCPFRRSIGRIVALAIVGAVGLGSAVIPGETSAQLAPWGGNSRVLVDEGATGGSAPGGAVGGIGLSGGTTGELLPPPPAMPRSRLLTPRPPTGAPVVEQPVPQVALTPPSRPQTRRTPPTRPAARPAPRPKAPAARPLAAPPAIPEVAKAPPTPLTKPEPAAAPPPAPKMAMPAAAPPPTPKMAKPAAAPPPAPKMAKPAAAPPPTPKMAKPAAAPPPAPKMAKPAPAPPPAPKMAKPAPAPIPPAPAAAPKPPALQQQAARTPGPGAAPLQSVAFASGNADLSGDSRKVLDSFAGSLTEAPNLRMQLLAYAGEPNLSASQARRLSLSRALAVRSHLISKGIRSTRIDVRALGNKVPSGTPNRVDLKTITR